MRVGRQRKYLTEAAQSIFLAVAHIFVAPHGHYQPRSRGQTAVKKLFDLAHLKLGAARGEVADNDERIKTFISHVRRAQLSEIGESFRQSLLLYAVLVIYMYIAHDRKAQGRSKALVKRHWGSLFL